MAETHKVAVVVCSYQRKELLERCLEALALQTRRPDWVVVVDNASKDGTTEAALNCGITNLTVLRMRENTGGAGGFYRGIAYALETLGATAVLLMDDDGVPAPEQVESLLQSTKQHGLGMANALVISNESTDRLSFGLPWGTGTLWTEDDACMVADAHGGFVPGTINPFNGTLIVADVIRQVGNLKREMFVWGDENEFQQRVLGQNIPIGTVVAARHHHPNVRKTRVRFGPTTMSIAPEWAENIWARNLAYLSQARRGRAYALLKGLWHCTYFLVRAHPRRAWTQWRYWLDGLSDTYRLQPSRQLLVSSSEQFETLQRGAPQ